MEVVVGKNDAGKSSLLYAMDAFFNGGALKPENWSRGCGDEDRIEIMLSFANLESAKDKLTAMRLLSKTGELVVKRSFQRGSRKPVMSLLIEDYVEEDFKNLYSKNEPALNKLGEKYNLVFQRSGRSITNDSKREKLAEFAETMSARRDETWVNPDEDALVFVERIIPTFTLFRSDIDLETERSEVQNPFQILVETIMQRDAATEPIQEKIRTAVESEVKKIEANLTKQTGTLTGLKPVTRFQWNKLVALNFETEDEYGTRVPLEYRGLGVQRLVMVAFFRYLAEKSRLEEPEEPIRQRHMIFAIEEPETYLHPSAQRDLIKSFEALIDSGYQIIVTSHSPVFAAEVEPQGLILIVKDRGFAKIIQRPQLTPERVIDELGILPRDQLIGYNACVFVEGKGDQVFLETVAEKLKTAGLIAATFRERNIGLVVVGGDNLRFYVEGQMVKKLSRRFAVLKDSDRKMRAGSLSSRILGWKSACEEMGGLFLILNKRQIENYFHPAAIQRVTQKIVIVEDYNDVKKLISTDYEWERHLKPIVEQMTVEEILERDKHFDGAMERHELVEKIGQLLQLSEV